MCNLLLCSRINGFGSYGFILVYPKDGGNIFRRECFDEILVVDALARNVSVTVGGPGGKRRLAYADLCARWENKCFSSETIKINNVIDKIEAGAVNLTWPLFFDEDAFEYIILPSSIGKPNIV